MNEIHLVARRTELVARKTGQVTGRSNLIPGKRRHDAYCGGQVAWGRKVGRGMRQERDRIQARATRRGVRTQGKRWACLK